MSYGALTSKQTVSFNNLQNAVNNGVFQLLSTIPSSSEQITKSDASTYVSLNTSYTTYSSKSSNQLIVKQDLKPSFQYSSTFYWDLDCAIVCGWSNSTNACNGYLTAIYNDTLYWNGTLAVGTRLFTEGLLRYSALGYEYYVLNNSGTYQWFTVNNYDIDLPLTTGTLYGATIASMGTCATLYSFTARASNNSASDACTDTNATSITLYTYDSSVQFQNGATYYQSDGVTPYNGTGYTYWADNVSCLNGSLNSSGVFTSSGACTVCA